MKITKSRLKQIIKEEINEGFADKLAGLFGRKPDTSSSKEFWDEEAVQDKVEELIATLSPRHKEEYNNNTELQNMVGGDIMNMISRSRRYDKPGFRGYSSPDLSREEMKKEIETKKRQDFGKLQHAVRTALSTGEEYKLAHPS